MLGALGVFQLKHFVCDFALQTLRQVQAKAHYGKRGGIEHAGLHALLSIPALLILTQTPFVIAGFVAAEFVVHYHVDFGKGRIDKAFSLNTANQAYWIIFGLDQLLHQMTYLAIVAAIEVYRL